MAWKASASPELLESWFDCTVWVPSPTVPAARATGTDISWIPIRTSSRDADTAIARPVTCRVLTTALIFSTDTPFARRMVERA